MANESGLDTAKRNFMADVKAILTECNNAFYEIRYAGGKLDILKLTRLAEPTQNFQFPYTVFEFKANKSAAWGIRGKSYTFYAYIHYVQSMDFTAQLSVTDCKKLIADALENRVQTTLTPILGRSYRILATEYEFDDSEDNPINVQSNDFQGKYIGGTLKLQVLVNQSIAA